MSLTAAQVIDGALAALGPNGEHWIQGMLVNQDGNRCLIGALWAGGRASDYVERVMAESVVHQVINDEYGPCAIHTWNDSLSDFGPVRAVLEKAKANLEGLT